MKVGKMIDALETLEIKEIPVVNANGDAISGVREEDGNIYLICNSCSKLDINGLIEQLHRKERDMDVVDTSGSRICLILYTNNPARGMQCSLFLKSINDVDIEEEVSRAFENGEENGMDEYDIFLQLGEKGYRLEDLKNTCYYEMAKQFTETHSWEQ